jgi:hypothetical protein
MSRKYTVQLPATSVSGAITLIQIKAGTNNSIRLLSCFISQNSSTTNAQQNVRILRKSAAATVTSFTPIALNPTDAAAAAAGGTAATGNNASAEGTDGNVIFDDAFSILTGWIYKPIPEEMVEEKGAGIIAVKFNVAPTAAQTFKVTAAFEEFG